MSSKRAFLVLAAAALIAAWPLVETLAIQHAKGLRRAVEDYADDPAELDVPRLRAVG